MGAKQIIRPRYDAETHTYLHPWEDKRLPGFTEIAKDVGMQKFGAIPKDVLEHALMVGRAVHLATHYHDMGTLDISTVSDEIKPYLEAYVRFKEDTGFKVLETERPVANLEWGYACTPDRFGKMKGQGDVVVELKKAMPQEWHHVQVEAQAMCFPGNPDKFLIQLLKTGKWKPHLATAQEKKRYRGLWLSAVSIYHFNHKGEKDLWRP